MSLSNPKKQGLPSLIDIDGKVDVSLSFDASALAETVKTDVVLLMDRSYSMDAEKMYFAKQGAYDFIKVIAGEMPGEPEADLPAGTRIGIVSFATSAAAVQGLTGNRADLNAAVSNLARGGETNHFKAFEKAFEMLTPKKNENQAVVLFTDGLTTQGGDASPIVDEMKRAGIEIFCIGLLNEPGDLAKWAGTPKDSHLFYSDDARKLDEFFKKVSLEMAAAAAKDIEITDTLSPDFKISDIKTPSVGKVRKINDRRLIWNIEAAGLYEKTETCTLNFEITHVGKTGGIKEFNLSTLYKDRDGNRLIFPKPEVRVKNPPKTFYPEKCPPPFSVNVPFCSDYVTGSISDVIIASQGRIVETSVTLESVLPKRRTSVTIVLSCDTPDKKENVIGTKHMLIPAHDDILPCDIILKGIRFSCPGEIDTGGKITARAFANYADAEITSAEAVVKGADI